jgi:hypothetical protein
MSTYNKTINFMHPHNMGWAIVGIRWVTILFFTLLLGVGQIASSQTDQTPVTTKQVSERSKSWKSFEELRRKYRLGDLNDAQMWKQLMEINKTLQTLPPAQQAAILQTQARVLKSGGFPILAAINAAQALRRAPHPLDDENKRSWAILKEVSREKPIQNLLEIVADNVNLGGKLPASFGTDWRYI